MTSATNHFNLGLIGYPVKHSISPQIHIAALASVGFTGSYSLFPIAPSNRDEMLRLLFRLKTGELNGLNVTIPHKRAIMAELDAIDDTAAAVQAVNTIAYRDGRLTGWNTDIEGFKRDLENALSIKPGSALVLGAGGAARGVVYALLRGGWSVNISARDADEAGRLAEDLGSVERILPFPPDAESLNLISPTLIVNATPLGMSPDFRSNPWPGDLPLPASSSVYDLVYNPRETGLLRMANQQGIPAVGGMGMLVEQAALAFEIWTGFAPSIQELYRAAETALPDKRVPREKP